MVLAHFPESRIEFPHLRFLVAPVWVIASDQRDSAYLVDTNGWTAVRAVSAVFHVSRRGQMTLQEWIFRVLSECFFMFVNHGSESVSNSGADEQVGLSIDAALAKQNAIKRTNAAKIIAMIITPHLFLLIQLQRKKTIALCFSLFFSAWRLFPSAVLYTRFGVPFPSCLQR